MNGNKMRTFLEIIYNCPFILLVIFTSLVFVLFFDGAKEHKDEQEVAVLRLSDEGAEEENSEKGNDIAEESGQKKDDSIENDFENEAEKKADSAQNAGARKEKEDEMTINKDRKTDHTDPGNTGKAGRVEKHTTEFVEYRDKFPVLLGCRKNCIDDGT